MITVQRSSKYLACLCVRFLSDEDNYRCDDIAAAIAVIADVSTLRNRNHSYNNNYYYFYYHYYCCCFSVKMLFVYLYNTYFILNYYYYYYYNAVVLLYCYYHTICGDKKLILCQSNATDMYIILYATIKTSKQLYIAVNVY